MCTCTKGLWLSISTNKWQCLRIEWNSKWFQKLRYFFAELFRSIQNDYEMLAHHLWNFRENNRNHVELFVAMVCLNWRKRIHFRNHKTGIIFSISHVKNISIVSKLKLALSKSRSSAHPLRKRDFFSQKLFVINFVSFYLRSVNVSNSKRELEFH